MSKIKTSVYIDKELWDRFKSYAKRRGIEVSKLLEQAIRRELQLDILEEILIKMEISGDYDIDFEPVEPIKGKVSDLVRVMRDERSKRVS